MWVLWRIPLSMRVPLLAAALMVAVGIVASQQVLGALDRMQDARIRELTKLHVEALSVALGPHVLRDDVWEVYDTLERAAGESEGRRMVFTAVADEEGRVMAATDPARAPVDSLISDIAGGAQSPGELSIAGEEASLPLAAPLIYQGREVGTIVTELDVSDLIDERRSAGRLLLLGNMALTGVLAILGYAAMRRMLRPITRLAQRMSETAHAPEPMPESELPRGDTELTRLVQTYNAMAGAVEAKRETERRLAERERFVSLGRVSSSLAHEINNPLGGLLNAADTIRKYADRPDVVRQSADLLTRGLKHLRDVARATLDQNRLDRSGAPLTREDIEDLHLLISPEIKRQQQQLDWLVAPENADLTGLAAAPVRQVMLNLLLNASSAAGKGGHVRLRLESGDAEVRLEVSDNGRGLSEDAQKRLMSSEPLPPGGGVGLRLVHDLVAELGGRLNANRRGGETVIEVLLTKPAKAAVRKC